MCVCVEGSWWCRIIVDPEHFGDFEDSYKMISYLAALLLNHDKDIYCNIISFLSALGYRYIMAYVNFIEYCSREDKYVVLDFPVL